MAKLTHYGESGEVRMVDVTAKEVTSRTAVARGFVRMHRRVLAAIRALGHKAGAAGSAPALRKGNPLEVARVAGIAAAKRTSELIPLCHPLPLTHIDVTARLCKNGVEIESRVTATARTGVAGLSDTPALRPRARKRSRAGVTSVGTCSHRFQIRW